MQLVGDSVVMLDTMRNKLFDRQAVYDKFSVYPECIVDYLALCGDSSDNIPGVAGIGPKTASRLLQRFGSMEQLYADDSIEQLRTSSMRGAVGHAKKLVEHKKDAELSYWLATIKKDVPLELDLSSLEIAKAKEELFELFAELEFEGLTQRMRSADAVAERANAAVNWQDAVVMDGMGAAAAAGGLFRLGYGNHFAQLHGSPLGGYFRRGRCGARRLYPRGT